MANLSAGYTFGSSETVTNTKLAALVNSGTVTNIVNADISASAAITYSKLNLTGNVSDADINASAGIQYSKLSMASSIKNSDMAVGVGTSANNIVALNGSAQLPAVDGSLLTNITQANLSSISDYGTSGSSSTSKAQTAIKIAYGTLSVTGSSSATVTNLPFASASSYTLIVSSDSDPQNGYFTPFAVRNSGSQATLYANDSHSVNVSWLAIGT